MTCFARAALPLFLALLHLGAPQARAASLPKPTPLAALDGDVIVRFKASADTLRKHALAAGARGETVESALDGRAQTLGARVGRTLGAGAAISERMQVVRAPGVDAATLARQLAADPEVEFAVPNGRKRRLTAPNDPLYPAAATGVRPTGPDSGQWYLRKPDSTIKSAIDIETAWAFTRGSASVVVAVLDTGVRFDHPDLGRAASGGKLLPGYDFVSDAVVANDGDGRDSDPSDPGDWVTAAEAVTSTFSGCGASDSSWHGTSTASLVGAIADNSLGMAGAAPNVLVQPLRVLGKCFGTDADIQAAMRWAAGISVPGVPDNPTPAKVINMSLGGDGSCTAAYQAVVDEVVARGVTIVAAAGNSTGGPVTEPANCRGVIGVLALRHAGTKVGFSDLGPEIAIAAPGGNCINIDPGTPCLYPILAATNTGTRGPVSSSWTDSFDISVGTSFAAPLVAGVASLMVSRQPQISVAQLRSLLQSTARAFPTSGADNGPSDPTPVTQCVAPQTNVQQLQCYCTSALCGAGMMDAGAAVTAASGLVYAAVSGSPASPVAGQAITFTSAGSFAQVGANIASYTWTLVDGGGIATGFTGATNTDTATLTPSGAGTLRVRVTITDSLGGHASADITVTVAAAPSGGGSSGGGGGGGAMSGVWLVLLATAAWALRRPRQTGR